MLACAAIALVAAVVLLRIGLDGGDTTEATLEITPIAVSTIPGQMRLPLRPCGASSADTLVVNPIRPCLEAT